MRTSLRNAFGFHPGGAPLFALLLCLIPRAQSAQNQAPAAAQTTATLPPVNRFEGSTKFQAKNGQSHDVRVTIHQWTVLPKQKIDSLAEHGFLLVTVRSGKVNVTVNGQASQHRTDDIWTVPDNAKMSVEAPGEAAVLEVVSFTAR